MIALYLLAAVPSIMAAAVVLVKLWLFVIYRLTGGKMKFCRWWKKIDI